ncbi:IS1/IS1595 family N-terminal zinc-binding domain-containing protein, partial [Streptomyces erythrogriseus]
MGTTSSGKQRWRCTHCGHTFTNPNTAKTSAYRFAIFIDWITGQRPLDAVAAAHNVSRRTLIRWFTYFWFIIVPCKPDPYRVYDQLFIDGTYFHKKCLLVAATSEHVVAWHWCTRETAYDYAKLFDLIAEPLVVTTDGSGGANKAIKQ